MSGRRLDLFVRLLLAAAILVVYGQVWTHQFLNFDDTEYVTRNPHVVGGLTLAGLRWAFTGIHSANWHPLTTLSHMLDVEIFGLHAGSHLAVNAALHAATSVLLYEVLVRTTGRRGASAFTAALFAFHPLRVESVAWVSERKDVLSALFGMLTIAGYVAYARRPGIWRYTLAGALFALGLLAKPMLVTLPFALLLLDYWPLGRILEARPAHPAGSFPARSFSRLVVEKIPLLLLALGASAVTFLVQRQSGAVVSTADLPVPMRVENALVAYASYLLMTVWPAGLAVFYPLQIPIPWQVAASSIALVTITAVVVLAFRQRRYLLTGWLWYLGTLVPVIGLVHVGDQAMADRYTYLPSIGLYLMAVWGVSDLLRHWRHRRIALGIAAAMVLLASVAATWVQIGYWRDPETLFRHALDVTKRNHVAHTNLGAILLEDGRAEEALAHFEAAVKIRPEHAQAQINIGIARGIALARLGDEDGAAARYAEVLGADPSNAMAHFNWGVLLAEQGDLEAAVDHYEEALRLAPDYAKAHNNLGLVLAHQGRWSDAIGHYRSAIDLAPHLAPAFGNLGVALESTRDRAGALAAYQELVRLQPDEPRARYNLAALLADIGRKEDAVVQYREALKLAPGWEPAQQALANILGAGTATPETGVGR